MRDLSSRRFEARKKIRFSWLAVVTSGHYVCSNRLGCQLGAIILDGWPSEMPKAELREYTEVLVAHTN